MHFIFRCDSSFTIGSGHLMRCLSLASKFAELNIQCSFICQDLPGHMMALIEQQGFQVLSLQIQQWSQEKDAQLTLKTLESLKKPAYALVVDNYALDEKWESYFYQNYSLIVIDDLANRSHLCHLLIDNNYHSTTDLYKELVPSACKTLLGPRYSFLREEFIQPAALAKKNYVLSFFGGTDPTNETQRLIEALRHKSSQLSYKIIVSKSHAYLQSLQALELPAHCTLLVGPSNIPELMANAGLYLGSGGSITWERMYMGLPGLVISIADNQTGIAQDLATHGCQTYLGTKEEVDYSDAISLCEKYFRDENWLTQTSQKGQQLVRPIDAVEILESLLDMQISPAKDEHIQFLYDLRSDDSVRSMYVNQMQPSFSEHQKWFSENTLKSRDLHIIHFAEQPVGQVRIDQDVSISISLLPQVRGRRLATFALIVAIEKHFRHHHLGKSTFQYKASIKKDNLASIRSFQNAGFTYHEPKDNEHKAFLEFKLKKGKSSTSERTVQS